MAMPSRIQRVTGLYSLVDKIPFRLPVACTSTPTLFAVFTIDLKAAAALLPGTQIHPLNLFNKGLLVVTVVNYQVTNIGKYIEYSIAIACTHGASPAPPLVPAIFQQYYGVGQFVYDLPVSTEISVKGGKGIWGMPKHQANLDFIVTDESVSSQYDLDGKFAMKVTIARPRSRINVNVGAANYCTFRGLLVKSYVYFQGTLEFALLSGASGSIILGDHPRVQPLKTLGISKKPIFTGFFADTHGVLDDYFESWFLSCKSAPTTPPEGLESVVNLGQSQQWLTPPDPALVGKDGR